MSERCTPPTVITRDYIKRQTRTPCDDGTERYCVNKENCVAIPRFGQPLVEFLLPEEHGARPQQAKMCYLCYRRAISDELKKLQ